MTVEWTRPDLDPGFVLVWRDGVELESKKHPSYEGRVSVFTDELKRGNVSLKLSKVKISDGGRYRCFIPDFHAESTVQLVVGAVSSPVVQMTKNNSIVVLQCESEGWYPKPEVLWLDGEGNVLSAGPTETVRGPDGLYTVSSRVTVEERHSNNFTCRVQQKNINQIREMQIHVPEEITDPSDSSSTSSSSAAAIIGVLVGIMLTLAAVFVVWKWRQNRSSNKKQPQDEEAQKNRSHNPEQESLLGRETDKQKLTAESETVNDLDKFEEETGLQTQIHEETQQGESNNAESVVNQATELQSSGEGQRQTDQALAEGGTETGLDKAQVETETKPINEKRDAPNPAENDLNNICVTNSVSNNTEQLTEERETENNLQTEEETEEKRSSHDKTEVQCLKEEEKHAETLNDKEKETPLNKLKTKEREPEKNEERVSRLLKQMKDKEEQINQLKQQLEEVERQRAETERKIHSVNMQEEAAEEEEDEAVKLLPDTMNDLERKKAELKKELLKREKQLERQKKEEIALANRKIKETNKKEEIMKRLKRAENQNSVDFWIDGLGGLKL
ncbi:uncharacterized protein ABDE67_020144 [Symphorus nematophorus]